MIAAQLDENKIVIKRLVVDHLAVLPNLVDGATAVIGATYDPQNGTFTPPDAVVIVPDHVAMVAGRVALDRAGVLASVESTITSINGESQIWWEKSDKIRRNFPLVEQVRVAMGWTNDYVDQLFITARQIEAEG